MPRHFSLISFSCTHKINHNYIHTQTWQISLTLVLFSIINCIKQGWKIYSRPTLQDFIFLHNHHWNLWQEINTNQFNSKKFLNAEDTHIYTHTLACMHEHTHTHTYTCNCTKSELGMSKIKFPEMYDFHLNLSDTVVTLKLVNVTGTTCCGNGSAQVTIISSLRDLT